PCRRPRPATGFAARPDPLGGIAVRSGNTVRFGNGRTCRRRPEIAAAGTPQRTRTGDLRHSRQRRRTVTVHFIGAGPGAADLITLRGAKLLASCPVCLYAGSIVSPELLRHCGPDTKL